MLVLPLLALFLQAEPRFTMSRPNMEVQAEIFARQIDAEAQARDLLATHDVTVRPFPIPGRQLQLALASDSGGRRTLLYDADPASRWVCRVVHPDALSPEGAALASQWCLTFFGINAPTVRLRPPSPGPLPEG